MSFRQALYFLSALLCIAVLVGCCGLLNPAARLYGKWKLDVDASIDRIAGGNDLQAGLARAAWGVFGGDIIIEFRSDGTGTLTGNMLGGGGTEDGTWAVKSVDGDNFVIEFKNESSGQMRDVELQLTTPDTFEIEGDDGNVVIFRRVAE